ncbi:VOC family protein [Myroides odoratus]|uniref:VOC family protein n=1 Tax=Myroides odoratus TaxID=256 RepID=UPI0007661A60|nr:VOC family protein [Myroides odoratus]
MIKYSYTIMYVKQVEATVAFYESAFGFERKFITPEEDYGELISGDTTLAFAAEELAQMNLSQGFTTVNKDRVMGIELGFVVEDVEHAVQRAVAAGASIYEPVKVKPWGQTVAYVTDCNGFLIELCTAMQA